LFSKEFKERKHLFKTLDEQIEKEKYDTKSKKLARHRVASEATIVDAKIDAHKKI